MGVLKYAVHIVADAFRRFMKHDCFIRAAALSFFAFFSLIPILFIITAMLGFVLGARNELLDEVVRMARQNIPFLSESIIRDLRGLVANWKTLGWVGIFFLLWSADFVLFALEHSLFIIFEIKQTRSFILRRLSGMLLIIVVIFFVLVSFGITTLSRIVAGADIHLFGIDIGYYLVKSPVFRDLLPFLLVTMAVAFAYKIIAARAVAFVYALVGSTVFTVLWEVAKRLFAWYISNFANFNKFYGSIGALMVLLLWIFYSMIIFLFGAALARAAHVGAKGE